MPSLKRYLAIIPDFPNVLSKRMEVRAKHLESFKKSVEAGVCAWGGGLAVEHAEPGSEEPLQLVGSALTVYAESKNNVMDILSNDIYAKSGVWDLKNATIHAFYEAGK